MKILMLVTDAYGAGGGIAQANRDLIETLAELKHELVVLSRNGTNRILYSLKVFMAVKKERFDLIFCGHLFMSPLAFLVSKILQVPYWLHLHGIEAWDRPSNTLRHCVEGARLVTSVSRYTRRRFLSWAKNDPHQTKVLPNTVSGLFSPGLKNEGWLDRLGLKGEKVILTVGRISSKEQYKGQDRVIEALAALKNFPDAVYLIAGEGDDRKRLEGLAKVKGVEHRVHFLGKVGDAELPEIYRLADVFVMPSTREGFGIVFLEAAASGVPVVGLTEAGSVDALREGALGRALALNDAEGLVQAIADALGARTQTPEGVHAFSKNKFKKHLSSLMNAVGRS